MIAGSLLYCGGPSLRLVHVWHATSSYRTEGRHRFLCVLECNNSANMPWRQHIPKTQHLRPELATGLFGFPGLAWILSGRATIGLPVISTGAAIFWAIIPLLLSPYGDGRQPHLSPLALEFHLVLSAVTSTPALFSTMHASERRHRSALDSGLAGDVYVYQRATLRADPLASVAEWRTD